MAPAATETGGLKLAVESPDSALLIGRKGRNLMAMQYLINRMVAREENGRESERILVDIEDYQDRRKSTLSEMALRLAERAKETGRRCPGETAQSAGTACDSCDVAG